MFTRYILSLCLAIAAFNFGVNAAPPEKVVNGRISNIKYSPYLVSLRLGNSFFHFCGGAIISSRFILTAAHCLKGTRAEDIYVGIGSSKISQGRLFYRIENYYYPGEYEGLETDESALYDIAILKLAQTLNPNDKSWKSIKMASRDYPAGSQAFFAGWGDLFQDAGPQGYHTDNLYQLDATLAETSQCQRQFGGVRKDYHVCTLPFKGTGVCQGDSGGPLIVNNEVIGIASFTGVCGKHASIFARVRGYKKFIREVTGIVL